MERGIRCVNLGERLKIEPFIISIGVDTAETGLSLNRPSRDRTVQRLVKFGLLIDNVWVCLSKVLSTYLVRLFPPPPAKTIHEYVAPHIRRPLLEALISNYHCFLIDYRCFQENIEPAKDQSHRGK